MQSAGRRRRTRTIGLKQLVNLLQNRKDKKEKKRKRRRSQRVKPDPDGSGGGELERVWVNSTSSSRGSDADQEGSEADSDLSSEAPRGSEPQRSRAVCSACWYDISGSDQAEHDQRHQDLNVLCLADQAVLCGGIAVAPRALRFGASNRLACGKLPETGDALASRFIAVHAVLSDGHGNTASHLFPLEPVQSAITTKMLEAHKHRRTVLKSQGYNTGGRWWPSQGQGKGGAQFEKGKKAMEKAAARAKQRWQLASQGRCQQLEREQD